MRTEIDENAGYVEDMRSGKNNVLVSFALKEYFN